MVAASLLADPSGAQDLATLSGTVLDSQGAAIPGASVDISCGRERHSLLTDARGGFSRSDLPTGRCRLTTLSQFFEPHTTVVETGAPVTLVLHVRRFAYEVVVTPTRGAGQDTFDIPESLSVASSQDIDSRPHSLLTQVLAEETGVLLQQTTSAQTSPVIRGFTGQSNVHLLDGVRFNTAAWRSGPNQYTAWIGEGPIQSIEIVRGAGSVQYGSDALGGAIQYTVDAPSFTSTPQQVSGSVTLVGSSAASGAGAEADLAFRVGPAALRVGGSRRRSGDLRAGGGLDSHSALTSFLGLPSTAIGSRLPGTSFRQGGGFVLVDVDAGRQAIVHGLYMHEDQSGASRYDRLLGGAGLYRSGFEPQTLDFAVARYRRTDLGALDGLSLSLSLNRQADGRFEQSRPGARLDTQTGTTRAIGYQVQINKDAGRHQLMAGSEFYDESIAASRQLVESSGISVGSRPDIPDGTTYTSFGVFVQQSYDALPDRLTVRGGARYSRFGFHTTSDPLLGVIDDSVRMGSISFQGSAVLRLNDHASVTGNVSRGFRAPNAGDLGNIGLTGGGGFEITPAAAAGLRAMIGSSTSSSAVSTGQPVAQLKPEVAFQYEVGLKTRAGRVSAAINAFDMELFDFIQRRALVIQHPVVGTTISGFEIVRQDGAGLAYIAQDQRPIATRVNVDRARVSGVEAEGEVRFGPSWTARAYYSMAIGRVLPDGDFARRMNPPMGGAHLRWVGSRLWAEGALTFAMEQTRLSSGDLGDARIGAPRTRASIAQFFNGTATDMGLVRNGILLATGETLAQVQGRLLGTASSGQLFTSHPGHAVVGLRAGMQVSPGLEIAVIGENLGDRNYRLYGSGLDAPGANVSLRVRYRF
jgi:outer membrane receptor protein involved in Fe transport